VGKTMGELHPLWEARNACIGAKGHKDSSNSAGETIRLFVRPQPTPVPQSSQVDALVGPSSSSTSSSPRRGRALRFAALGILVFGVAGSAFGAARYRSFALGQANGSIAATSQAVGHGLEAQLRRDGDLTASVRTLVETQPNLNNAEFALWFKTMGVTQRYPESLGFGFVQPVPASQLPAYIAKANADPALGGTPVGAFVLTPPGNRPLYCLGNVGASTSGLTTLIPPFVDVCATPSLSPGLWLAADSGQVVDVKVAGNTFAMIAPTYRNRVVPASPVNRRSQLVAWTGGLFNASVLMEDVSAGQHALSVSLFRQNVTGAPILIATSGKQTRGHHVERTVQIEADGRWLVRVVAPTSYGAISPNVQGLGLFAAGLALSLMLFFLVRVLVGSRGRALNLVDEKTVELLHQALHDQLTGLPNRALILDRVEQALARSRRHNSAVAAMFIDLDNFKDINDTFGHAVGDELLREVAARLEALFRDSDTVGRLGGDEFVVIVEGDSLDAGAEVVAQRVLDILREPFVLGTALRFPCAASASVGVAVGDRGSAGDLLRDADVALYEAKMQGKKCFVVFQPAMQVAVHDRLELEMDLRHALGEDQFFVLYQPTFDLRTAAVTGVEALLRWDHPGRGVVSPDTFIPLAEDTGLIIDIGRWVLRQATSQAAAWHADGHLLSMSVNVSARQLESDDLVREVQDALTVSGLEPRYLTLEITETTIMRDATATARRLTALKAIGVRIAIDDFGTGYSSLAYLQQFPVDTLKIDRSFISGVATSADSAALIRTLIQLGKSLGIETLAEGIEDREQFERLQDEECESGQGYLVARPLPADAIPAFLHDWKPLMVGTGRGSAPQPL
jgi:diguanylate cyclase (GGDEF)-like protein